MHNKPYTNIILAAIFAFLLCSWGAAAVFAAEPTSITVSSVYEDRRGAAVPVEVFVTNAAEMASGVLELTFDPKVVQFLTATRSELLNGFLFAENLNNAKTGKIKFAWAAGNPAARDGKILDLSFKYLTAGGGTELQLTEAGIYDLSGNDMLTDIIDGGVSSFNGRKIKPLEAIVSPFKAWVIHFNMPPDPGTVNKHTIYVIEDASGEIVNTGVAIGENGKDVIVRPADKYAPGKYTLVIPRQIKSAGGKLLKDEVKMSFTVSAS